MLLAMRLSKDGAGVAFRRGASGQFPGSPADANP
jgi:hypothetical protein